MFDCKVIVGYENYLINTKGLVYSLKTNRFLKPGNINNYQFVCLCKNGISTNHLVHRLVAIHFIDNPNNYPDVDHKDFNRGNNDVSNLNWISHRQNTQIKQNVSKYGHNIRDTPNGKFRVCFRSGGKRVSKVYETIDDANKARDYFTKTNKWL